MVLVFDSLGLVLPLLANDDSYIKLEKALQMLELTLLTDGVVVDTRVRSDDNRVPVLSIEDECVRRTRDLLLCLLWGSRVRGLILGVEADCRGRSGVFGEHRATTLDKSNHIVVGQNVDAQVELADGSLELLSVGRTRGY
jgi:hypothetical protein